MSKPIYVVSPEKLKALERLNEIAEDIKRITKETEEEQKQYRIKTS